MSKDNSTLYLGIVAVASTVAYLYMRSKSENKSMTESIDGISIDIRPEVFVESLSNHVRMNPRYKDPLVDITKHFVNRAFTPREY